MSEKHWIHNQTFGTAFKTNAQGLGFDSTDAIAQALGVERMEDYPGGPSEAMDVLLGLTGNQRVSDANELLVWCADPAATNCGPGPGATAEIETPTQATQAPPQTLDILQFGDREQIRELKDRIKIMVPEIIAMLELSKPVGEAAALALAQTAISTGLNPFTREYWALPKKDKRGDLTGFELMAGIKGLRRAGRIQAKANGGVYPYWRPIFAFPDPAVADFLSLETGDIAIQCNLELCLSPNHPWYAANDHARFVVEGLGIFRHDQITYMEHMLVARKRAEADALKQAFDLPFSAADNGDFSIEDGTGG